MEGLQNLGIDGYSIILYIVNVGVLIAVLSYLLYKPVLNFVDQRRKHIADKISEADKLQKEFEKKLKEMEAAKEKAQAELRTELENMQKLIEEERAKLVSKMEQEREAMLAKASADIEKRKENLIKEVETGLLGVMQKIILEIVHHKVPENVIQESVADAWKAYRK